MKFSIKDFLSKCDQIRRKLRIWSHLLKKLLMENFIFCAVKAAIRIKNKTMFFLITKMMILIKSVLINQFVPQLFASVLPSLA